MFRTKTNIISKEDTQAVVMAISEAEKQTSGEIRVHVDKSANTDSLERAKQLFVELKMHETETRNGVLLYLNLKNHGFAIIGDEGIHHFVKDDYWNKSRDMAISHFKKGEFKEGLVGSILDIGRKLKDFFPYNENDKNELSNEISGLEDN